MRNHASWKAPVVSLRQLYMPEVSYVEMSSVPEIGLADSSISPPFPPLSAAVGLPNDADVGFTSLVGSSLTP